MKSSEITDAMRLAMHRSPALRQPNYARTPTPQNPRQTAQPERPAEREGSKLADGPALKETGPERLHLRIVSVRKRLLDPDNLVPKWTIDCLRYCGVIRDDTSAHLVLETDQRKAAKGEEEHTEVTIYTP